jgi:hypothetical protein
VLIAAERLLIKLRQPRSRAGELIELHRRLRAEVRSSPDADEPGLARAILEQKRRVSALLHGVGSWRGGAPGVTADLFDDHELAALAHAGTRPRDLVAPREDHAGCAFRGSTGCTLEVAHRPARCVHYACDTLRRELHARDQLDDLERDLAELNHRIQRFRAVRSARVDRQVLAPLLDAIANARRKPGA